MAVKNHPDAIHAYAVYVVLRRQKSTVNWTFEAAFDMASDAIDFADVENKRQDRFVFAVHNKTFRMIGIPAEV